eukprot:TRINITY_DN6090_c0_g1_i1.p1 TRINITY_DN6090_c0_g1~~TRINITY_DN6090_c0_g1_i1.p1  ORF type:complete len:310 (-),score=96.79 TRINITY_DN6090_c0_g1_i1:521-1450(-)
MNWFASKILEAETTLKQVVAKITEDDNDDPKENQSSSATSSPSQSEDSLPHSSPEGKKKSLSFPKLNLNRKKEGDESQRDPFSEVGITPTLIEFVDNVCQHPKTFVDFPLEENDRALADIPLSEWQVRHAELMLKKVESLGRLRFKLCPSQMKEDHFWKIYFMLAKNKIGPIDLSKYQKNSRPSPKEPPLHLNQDQRLQNSSPRRDPHVAVPADSPSSEILQLLHSPSSTKGSDIEEYFEQMMKENLDNSFSVEESIDPQMDNYFCEEGEISSTILEDSFDRSTEGKETLQRTPLGTRSVVVTPYDWTE